MVTIRDLHFAYRRRPVLSGLNLDLAPGHIYGLLGRNGTGKSTLLRSIGGFLFPQQGEIGVLGYTPRKRQPDFLQRIFLLPEELFLPPLPVRRWVRVQAAFYPHFSQEQFDKAAAGFSLPLDGRLDEMSYGQQKKALICFALATNVDLLLMDEPTNGLDIVSKSQFRKVMAAAVDADKCIVISTHQVKDLENLIDRVTIIDEGRILFDQTIDAISRTLHFRFSHDPQETSSAIYSESTFRGNALILPNYTGDESAPDLEMLYKAVMIRGEQLNLLFK